MKKIIISTIIIFAHYFIFAQYNPTVLQKSIVKVLIKHKGKASVCTGFMWKDTKQIITSLHAMRPDASISVIYKNKCPKSAHIIRVYKDADLVLLQVDSEPPAGVEALQNFSTETVPFNESIYALGYNSGAPGASSRTLKKGYISPETLVSLVPPKDKIELKKAGMPSLTLPIIYLEGSLLPGFSGAPVVNIKGELIGISDGGLESGASNVSWVIPAKFIKELENSEQTKLPENLVKASQSFSAEIEIDIDENIVDEHEAYLAVQQTLEEYYDVIEIEGFTFYKTKTRSLYELMETSASDNDFMHVINLFPDILFDYDNMYFDIYEDIEKGVILVMPEGKFLEKYQEGIDDFYVDFDWNKEHSLNFSLFQLQDLYAAMEERGLVDDIIQLADDEGYDVDPESVLSLVELVKRHSLLTSIDKEKDNPQDVYNTLDSLYYIEYFNENSMLTRQMYIVNGFDEDQQPYSYRIYYYLTLASDGNMVSATGVSNLNTDRLLYYEYLDCTNCEDQHQRDICNEATELLSLLLSVHFTTIITYEQE